MTFFIDHHIKYFIQFLKVYMLLNNLSEQQYKHKQPGTKRDRVKNQCGLVQAKKNYMRKGWKVGDGLMEK